MERAVYCVSVRQGEWTIELNDKPVAPCPSKETGVQAAVFAARKAYIRGLRAHVLAQEGNRFHSVWFNGKEAGTLAAAGNCSP